MKAVVLVGGFGTRLRPLTLTTPKQMLPIVDRPMIEWVVGHLATHGVDEAVLSLGYRPDAFTERYTEGTCAGVRLHYAVEPEPLDTAGAVGFAARDAGIDERFLVVNGDVLTDLDVTELVSVHERSGAEATIHLTPVDDPSRFGVVPIDHDGRVIEFVEKPPPGTAPSNWINAGTYVLEPSVLERIPYGERLSIERKVFPALVAEGTLYGWRSDTYWIDTGTPAEYIQAQLDLVEGRRGPAPAAVAEGVEVADTARVEHSVLMAGASVGAGASVRGSVCFAGARIGAGAQVTDSVLGARTVIGSAAVVRGSVLGDGEQVGEGEHLDDERRPDGSR